MLWPPAATCRARRGTTSTFAGSRLVLPGQEPQVLPVADPVSGRVTRVAGDEAGTRRAVEVGVPGPGQVARPLEVQPPHQRVEVGVGAVVLADLPGDDRRLGDDRLDL